MKKLIVIVFGIFFSILVYGQNLMNACGVYFNQPEKTFTEDFNQTFLGYLCYVKTYTEYDTGKIYLVKCQKEMYDKEDTKILFNDVDNYLRYNQEGVFKIKEEKDKYRNTYYIGPEGGRVILSINKNILEVFFFAN